MTHGVSRVSSRSQSPSRVIANAPRDIPRGVTDPTAVVIGFGGGRRQSGAAFAAVRRRAVVQVWGVLHSAPLSSGCLSLRDSPCLVLSMPGYENMFTPVTPFPISLMDTQV